MSEGDEEQTARSLALEQAYVHDVYEQCAERTVQGSPWPKIYQFLEELEPGALVCDVGCGNGKYLNVNHKIFKIGVDRCNSFTRIAKEKDNQVLRCDNLSLPFRDDTFDAVISVAVIHHFSTTERRVRAIKELSRVLRLGGRLVISVWAMEQKHRKFESQDVLVPWPRAYCISSADCPLKSRGTSIDERRGKNSQTYFLSKRNIPRANSLKSYWIDPIVSDSPSSSSLSSPNETCYSFFRRALQKLAGSRRNSRVWFLENYWRQNGGKGYRYGDYEDDEDIDELPIELRRLEDSSKSFGGKSRSLGNIPEAEIINKFDLFRSRSVCTHSHAQRSSKPRLVKQKRQFHDEEVVYLDKLPENTAIPKIPDNDKNLVVISNCNMVNRANVKKQSSMNEELMSYERLKERDFVRSNITKQTSLNDEVMHKGRAFDTLKETLYSGNATKKLQLIKSGLTNKIKQSTSSIEKVSGISIKNSFVRILQSWKSTDDSAVSTTTTPTTTTCSSPPCTGDNSWKSQQNFTFQRRDSDFCFAERRLSREDGSDSSKDGSFQSDTSVDSEDSFASVIYVPNNNNTNNNSSNNNNNTNSNNSNSNSNDSNNNSNSNNSTSNNNTKLSPSGFPETTTQITNSNSTPSSPRMKLPTETTNIQSQRLKIISVSPLLVQFPNDNTSIPIKSPPGIPPKTAIGSTRGTIDQTDVTKPNSLPIQNVNVSKSDRSQEKRPTLQKMNTTGYKSMSPDTDSDITLTGEDTEPLITPIESDDEKPKESVSDSTVDEDESRIARLNQIKELLKKKPGFESRTRPPYPIVRRATMATSGKLETVTKVMPRLMSLELFNPETDDVDSDSSGVSSPESAGSIVSIKDERYITKKASEEIAAAKALAESEKKRDELKQTKINKDISTRPKALDMRISPVESTWNEECRQQLIELTEKLSGSLINDIDQFCRKANADDDQEKSSLESTLTRDTNPCENDNSSNKFRGHSSETDYCEMDNNSESSISSDRKSIRNGNSIESSDIGDSIENTISENSSQFTDSSSSCYNNSNNNNNININNRRFCTTESSISLSSSFNGQKRSLSEEIPVRTLSGSSSQESLPSDQAQPAPIAYHQYYHVFREGELDQLINTYVENLHIIQSYYDHASWCVVAEKVQVWTI